MAFSARRFPGYSELKNLNDNKLKTTAKIKYFVPILFLSFVSFSFKKIDKSGRQSFELKRIAEGNSNCVSVSNGNESESKYIEVTPRENNTSVIIWKKGNKQNWSNGKYLVIEILDEENYCAIINIDFYKSNGRSSPEKIILQNGEASLINRNAPWLTSLMGILPKLKTKLVFPLSYLDAQNLFVTRSPRQLKGTISGDRLDPKDITKVILRFGPYFKPYFEPRFKIYSVFISNEKPKPYPPIAVPVIDKFGQWKLKDWKGKIHSKDELISRELKLKKSVESEKYPDNWDKYGGWKEKKFESTGFFRTQNNGKRWWLVDPDGCAFLSIGVDCIRKGPPGPVNGIEDLFDWLPGKNDSNYSAMNQVQSGMIRNQGVYKNMDFYIANLIRVFGKDWESEWNKITAGLIKKFRINTVGNWSDIDFAKEEKTPYVLPMQNFPATKIFLFRDFPDVFAKEYRVNSKRFASQLAEYKDDPYMIGYFLRNEPQWAFGYHNLAYEMFGTSQQSATKDKFVNWISTKYGGEIQSFNKSWNLDLKNFQDIESMTFKNFPSEKADSDYYEFSKIMVKRYADIPCDAITDKRIYEVATGQKAPYKKEVTEIPPIHY